MSRQLHRFLAWAIIGSLLLTGCHPIQPFYLQEDGDLSHYLDVATDIEYTEVDQVPLNEATMAHEPRTVTRPEFDEIWELSLEEVMSYTLNNSKVIRSFGQVRQFGQILQGPPERITSAGAGVATVYDPAIQESGQTGVEQALAQFDAVFSFNATWDRRDRPQNVNVANARNLQQDQVTINSEITKRTAVGTQWSIRNITIYDDTNVNGTLANRNLFSDYFTGVEAEFRQPLLRSRGTQVNRVPVVLARVRTDIALADFEFAVRGLVSEVERAYWELYFFYRNLSAAKTGEKNALATWQRVNALYQKGAPGGEAQNHARASEQYYFFRARVEEAFRDLCKSELRLRYLMGIASTDGRMIRPADEPTSARVEFDWHQVLDEALVRSVEIRRQKWTIKTNELALISARNQLLPQVDAVGIYRWLGLGDQFDSANRTGINFPNPGSTAIDELTEGRFQEHQLGIQAQIPLGFTRELAQLRNQQLLLARDQARLEDMELEVVSQLSDAIMDLEAQYKLAQTNLNRRVHAYNEVEALKVALDAGTATLDILLDAQRRQAEAEVAYYQSLMEYNVAIMNVHFRKGSLLDYNGVLLAEGPWPAKAYFDAHQRARQRDASYYLDYGFSRPNVISNGPVAQSPGMAIRQGSPDGMLLEGDEMLPEGAIIQGPIMFGDELDDAPNSNAPLLESPAAPMLEDMPADSFPGGDVPAGEPLPNGAGDEPTLQIRTEPLPAPRASTSPAAPRVQNIRPSSLVFGGDSETHGAAPAVHQRRMGARPQTNPHGGIQFGADAPASLGHSRHGGASRHVPRPTPATPRSSARGIGHEIGAVQIRWGDE